jgi:hypothetical protein
MFSKLSAQFHRAQPPEIGGNANQTQQPVSATAGNASTSSSAARGSSGKRPSDPKLLSYLGLSPSMRNIHDSLPKVQASQDENPGSQTVLALLNAYFHPDIRKYVKFHPTEMTKMEKELAEMRLAAQVLIDKLPRGENGQLDIDALTKWISPHLAADPSKKTSMADIFSSFAILHMVSCHLRFSSPEGMKDKPELLNLLGEMSHRIRGAVQAPASHESASEAERDLLADMARESIKAMAELVVLHHAEPDQDVSRRISGLVTELEGFASMATGITAAPYYDDRQYDVGLYCANTLKWVADQKKDSSVLENDPSEGRLSDLAMKAQEIKKPFAKLNREGLQAALPASAGAERPASRPSIPTDAGSVAEVLFDAEEELKKLKST